MSRTMNICRLADLPQHIDEVTGWLIRQWPDPEQTFAARKSRLLGPPGGPETLVAVAEGKLAGVIGFGRFQRKGDEHLSLFIDVLYVDEPLRDQGIGTALLAAAVSAAANVERELFVYTDVADWYQHRGWVIREPGPAPGHCVLSRQVSDGKRGDEFYDDDAVFRTYTARRQRADSANELLERPIIEALVGDVGGKDVLDLGCGGGQFGHWVLERGAASYTGVDASARMLELAAAALEGTKATLHCHAIESWQYPSCAFDLVVSRMALHYLEALVPALRSIRAALRESGRLVCSVEHPVLTSNDESGQQGGRRGSWLVDRYFERGPRVTSWMGGRVIKHHRTVEDYFRAFGDAGLRVDDLRESAPDPARFADPVELVRRRRIPLILFIAASVSPAGTAVTAS